MAEDAPLLLTPNEAARVLNVGRSFLYAQLIGPGKLPSVRLGRRRLIRRSDLEAFVEQLREGE